MAKPKANKKKNAGKAKPGGPPLPKARGKARSAPPPGGVPPLDAFDNLPKRKPPNLPGFPGYTEDPPPDKPADFPQKPARNKKKNTQSETPPKAVVPAKRRKRRKILGIAAFVAAIFLCICIIGAFILKIAQFEIKGECPYTLEELVAVFGAEEGDNLLFSFDAKKEQQRMQELLPYLEKVTIHRKPLNTIVFEVVAATEYYCVPVDDGYMLLSQGRKILQVAQQAPPGIMFLEGVQPETQVPGQPFAAKEEEVQQALDALLQGLADYGFEGVSHVNVTDPMRMYFMWQGRFKIIVGSKSNLDAKLNYINVLLIDTAQSKFTDADKGTLDVSGYPTQPNAVYTPS